MATFTHDGTTFDLAVTYADVTGVHWRWTGRYDERGEPLMASRLRGETTTHGPQWTLPGLYASNGPLIPLPTLPGTALMRHVLQAAS